MYPLAKIRAVVLAWLALPVLAIHIPVAGAQPAKRWVVVELFTSQGCYSCPPADRFLGKLAKRKDVLALSFHVDYWNYLGWRDPYSSHQATRRQRSYAWAMKRRSVYTPQIVVDGTLQGIGSYTGTINGLIDLRKQAQDSGVTVAIRNGAKSLTVSLKGGLQFGDCTVWLVYFDNKHTTAIPRGENAGKTLTYYNVVREFRRAAVYKGKNLEFPLPRSSKNGPKHDNIAVIVQRPRGGQIVGAAWAALR
ncbi:MAG: DUF1223 domain-containing protein [Rhodospirillaceae bacterium]|nr:DUF1223 domain-containing protein [Rhodospirillaceae bacterium]